MLLQKSWLNDLQKSSGIKSSTSIIGSASILQINILIKILHFITIGSIPLGSHSLGCGLVTNVESKHKNFRLYLQTINLILFHFFKK